MPSVVDEIFWCNVPQEQAVSSPPSWIKWRGHCKGIQAINICVTLFMLVMGFSLPGIAQDVLIEGKQSNTLETTVETSSKEKGIILLIHGLTGDEDTFSTWYPVMKADQQLKSNNITYKTLVYPTGVLDRLKAIIPGTRLPNLDDLSGWFLTELETKYRPEDYESVYLIGHSMGGLIIKSAIREKLLGKKEGGRLRNIKFIYFIATPHEGSDWASQPLLSWLEQVEDMKKNSPTLIKIDREFCENVKDTEIIYESIELQSKVVMLFGSQDDIVLQPPENSLCHKHYQTVNANHTSIVDLNKDKNGRGKESTVYRILTNAIKDSPKVKDEPPITDSVISRKLTLAEQNMAYIQTDRDSSDTLKVTFENGGRTNELLKAKLTILEREPIPHNEVSTPARWSKVSPGNVFTGKKIKVFFDDIKLEQKYIDFKIDGPPLAPFQSISYSLDIRWTRKQCVPKTSQCRYYQTPASIGGDYLVQVTFWDIYGQSYLTAQWCFGAHINPPKRDCKGIHGGSPSIQTKMWEAWGMPENNTVPARAGQWLNPPYQVGIPYSPSKKVGNYINWNLPEG